VDGGRHWSQVMGSPLFIDTAHVYVDPLTPTTLYGVDFDNGLYKSTDEGKIWQETGLSGPGLGYGPMAIDPSNPAILYAALNGVEKSMDGGVTWQPAASGLEDDCVMSLAIDPRHPTTLYAATCNAIAVYKTTDGGDHWLRADQGLALEYPITLAVDPLRSATVYAGTPSGLFRSTDGGASWAWFSAGMEYPGISAIAIDPHFPSRIYAGNRAGVFVPRNPIPGLRGLRGPGPHPSQEGTPITVEGTGFVPDSVVRWNGNDLPTTFLDETHLSADILPGLAGAPGTASLTVTNPEPGGGESEALQVVASPPAAPAEGNLYLPVITR
jgi:hypothetical protein